MGRKEKNEQQREGIRQMILKEAKNLFLKDGYEATSMRKIAQGAGISPTTIYLYYKDKSDMAYALHKEGFKILGKQFMVLQSVENAFERLKAMGKIYLRFALENPDFYEIMFIMKEPIEFLSKQDTCEWEEGEQAFNSLLNTVADCKKEGFFKEMDERIVALNIWALVHGLCSLKLQGHLDHVAAAHLGEDMQRDVLDDAYNGLILMISSLR
ncbi:TetR/AcrR family transcriptional regulator [Pedobacter montanisoli]|uniref:TetR/AcrR family transcriptional regulator n=1 Tax=Pedobacter montanisoli TaxID=2923277 RepID=A0ABS9ZWF6_9SPHI|nr:TetR/AcrR family transcriptional regulator [Pedobacter montanisoli]MCJ0742627.1 TetR/AcrR family transcriptional regulator [Pedobacter montanisoli]